MIRSRSALATVFLLSGVCGAQQKSGPADEAAVAALLDAWHKAAAAADEEAYFSHFTKDAVFFGSDATERWTRDEFRAWAKPHFASGKAWTFKAVKRHVFFAKEGGIAWFDEELETKNLGPCRGTGVLVVQDGRWKIAQYNLSTPIPNEVFDDVKKIIARVLEAKEKAK